MYTLALSILIFFAFSTAPRDASSGSIPPAYGSLKDLYLTTELVVQGQATVTIVIPTGGIYDSYALRIQEAILARTGVEVTRQRGDCRRDGVLFAG